MNIRLAYVNHTSIDSVRLTLSKETSMNHRGVEWEGVQGTYALIPKKTYDMQQEDIC